MTVQILRRLIAVFFAISFSYVTPAWSQNAMQTNTRTDSIYDGVAYEQVKAIFSSTIFNGSSFTVVEHNSSAGTPFFSLTSPELPFAIYISCVEEAFSGEGDGIYAGLTMFTVLSLGSFAQADVNDFNRSTSFTKFSPGQTSGVFSVDRIAAGGITEASMVSTFIPFFGGLKHLLSMASAAQNTVSYSTGGEVTWSQEGYVLHLEEPPMLPAKISTSSFNDLSAERLIHEFVDKAASGGH